MTNEPTAKPQLGNWYAVAAAAAASFGLAGGAHEADAAQVVVTLPGGGLTLPASATSGFVYFNMLDPTGASAGTIPPSPSGPPPTTAFALLWELNPSNNVDHATLALADAGHGSVLMADFFGSYAAKLHTGAAVNANTFGPGFAKGSSQGLLGATSNSGTSHFGQWKPGDDAYLGLNVYSVNSTSASYFGWAEIKLGSNLAPTLVAYGFNDEPSGTAYTGGVAAAPEPSSLLLLASGAAGLAAYRRRRAQRRAA